MQTVNYCENETAHLNGFRPNRYGGRSPNSTDTSTYCADDSEEPQKLWLPTAGNQRVSVVGVTLIDWVI